MGIGLKRDNGRGNVLTEIENRILACPVVRRTPRHTAHGISGWTSLTLPIEPLSLHEVPSLEDEYSYTNTIKPMTGYGNFDEAGLAQYLTRSTREPAQYV